MDMDDDSDDSSQIETLDQFREKWHNELNTTQRNQRQTTKSTTSTSPADSTGRKDADHDGDGTAKINQVNIQWSPFQCTVAVHSLCHCSSRILILIFIPVRLNRCLCRVWN